MKTQNSDAADNRTDREERTDSVLGEIQDALRGLKYGHVTIVVQDGVVVQIERVERRRLARRGTAGGDSCP